MYATIKMFLFHESPKCSHTNIWHAKLTILHFDIMKQWIYILLILSNLMPKYDRLTKFKQCLNLTIGYGFVSISEGLSSVETLST